MGAESRGAALLLALAVSGAAWAEEPPRTGPAAGPQREWARGVARALELPLDDVAAIERPARAPGTFQAAGTHLELARLSVEQLRFPTPAAAAAWAALDPDYRRVYRADPVWVVAITQITFRDLNDELPAWDEDVVPAKLDRLEQAWAPGAEPPADLGAQLEAGPVRSRSEAELVEDDPGQPGWSGVRARLGALTLERRTCATPALADGLLAEVHAEAERVLAEQRGAELVIAVGAPLAEAARAAQVLRAAWEAGPEPGERRGLRALAPAASAGQDDELAALFLAPGAGPPAGVIWDVGRELLLVAREHPDDEQLEGALRWRFLDAGARNHVQARSQEGAFSEARATARSMLFVRARSAEAHQREKDYLLAVLTGLGGALPAAEEQPVELLGPEEREDEDHGLPAPPPSGR